MTFTQWACRRCGQAFFGCPPETGLCIECQEETGLTPADPNLLIGGMPRGGKSVAFPRTPVRGVIGDD